MNSKKIITAYRFDDFKPLRGAIVHCFKTEEALFDFVKRQGNSFAEMRFWKVTGTVIRDEGGTDGWVMTVTEATEIPKKLY